MDFMHWFGYVATFWPPIHNHPAESTKMDRYIGSMGQGSIGQRPFGSAEDRDDLT